MKAEEELKTETDARSVLAVDTLGENKQTTSINTVTPTELTFSTKEKKFL